MSIIEVRSTPNHRSLSKRSKTDLIDRIRSLRTALHKPQEPGERELRTKTCRELASMVMELHQEFPE